MKLYFLRHATASHIAASDDARELTSAGEEEARMLGLALAKLGAAPDQILSSPLCRAVQTAKTVAEQAASVKEIVQIAELRNGVSTSEVLQHLAKYQANEIFLVGHAPSLPQHISMLIGAAGREAVALGKGSVACVEVDILRAGAGQLRWLLRQKQLRLIARP